MAYTIPTVADFKAYFTRDFPYGVTDATVKDTDIQRAIDEALCFMNQCLGDTQACFNTLFLNLTAHFMVTNLQASSSGVNSCGNIGIQSSRSVGSVSESLSIPQRILDNPEYAWLTTTAYGTKFLMMVLPQLSGQVYTVCGRTLP
jgi:hypothetical protein